MELFLPSLLVLLLGAIMVLAIIPRITPFYIFILTVVFFIISVYAHYMMFRHEYTVNLWKDTLGKSVPAVLGTLIAIGILVSFLNLFTNIKITPPSFSVFQSSPQSIVKGYSNVPIEKIIELEKQL